MSPQPPPARAPRRGPQIGLWKQVTQNENYLASIVPAQLPHRVNRGTGCQNIQLSSDKSDSDKISFFQVALEVKATMASTLSTS